MKVIVIGNGMVGYKFCEKLRSMADTGIELIVYGEEPRPAYDRVHLTSYLDGKTADDLLLADLQWYKDNNIILHTGDPVIRIDRHRKTVHTLDGKAETYDYLVMATGSAAFVPPVPGIDKKGVFVYRTIEDLDAIRAYAANAKSGIVIGGGLLGLEAAKALLDLQVPESFVVEFSSRLMPRQIDEQGSAILQNKLNALGINILTNRNSSEVLGENEVTGLAFTDGTSVNADIIIVSAGIKPRDELALQAGLTLGPRGGIIVNNQMQTSDPEIFAIGECALHNQMIYGLVAPGYDMAAVAAATILGEEKAFTGFDMSTKLKLIGVDVASFGDPFPLPHTCHSIVFEDRFTGVYKRLNITPDGTRLLGGILIGDAADYNMLLQTTKNSMPLPANPSELLTGAKKEGDANSAAVTGLPDDAIICSCESVSKGRICGAVTAGLETFDDVKKATKAGSCCGGCAPMVKDLITATMKAEGRYIRNVICEHFSYSRQEMLDLIKVKALRSFDEVIDTYGHGDGCEVCKPVVASILASLWNELILDKGNDTAQDSNDRYLANIQKGGTYSVVPRIPGGEITPEKLIVIGQVAVKYNLYTKITGGQRIDLFGAHLSDLPFIWEELIEAGFESGHAYGKALRTVKSCVGSTWCRFGLHDSVSFAIQIEERYRGLRAPHKIKSAVSGCIRECAEAQSKDFGIIATEKGWNLYVCGNGGSKPQHAKLLASDIDSETCIKYIDRFLMFYIKTADPLTRTATWLNKLDGGMDYLHNVVVNDSLGIAAELEAAMQLLVDHYKCEWKEVVESPELRKRFSHFINAPEERDPTVKFEKMRDQKRAAEWK
ncbi:nitrite reductase large subunit NirB [Chitinophaga sp. sic0106]|uniref:nitrite reductase large subunit NirB n=1 Tax=Chitinophaga sp. sic0106 TaxID=2854785 RepID=UPI001C458869|nr:nitrite reductase large subunit NirB [Chitinophaga sp. sic0106]MBV7530299.1 nitrite reductase large subunit NirB [Chitinophaga sp. sic0106]